MKKAGFTLIELLVVISIISLLSSIVLSSLSSARANGRDAQRVQNLRQVKLAIEQFIAVNGQAPLTDGENERFGYDVNTTSGLAVALSPYIAALPKDPCPNCRLSFFEPGNQDDTDERLPSIRYRRYGPTSQNCISSSIGCSTADYELYYSGFESRAFNFGTFLY